MEVQKRGWIWAALRWPITGRLRDDGGFPSAADIISRTGLALATAVRIARP
jgi:hypothetical protein